MKWHPLEMIYPNKMATRRQLGLRDDSATHHFNRRSMRDEEPSLLSHVLFFVLKLHVDASSAVKRYCRQSTKQARLFTRRAVTTEVCYLNDSLLSIPLLWHLPLSGEPLRQHDDLLSKALLTTGQIGMAVWDFN